MTKKHAQPHRWQLLVQRLAATRPSVALLSRILHHLDGFLMRRSKEQFSLTGLLSGVPVIKLTTTGAKSGLARTVPLLGIRDREKIVLIASNWGQQHHPAWYHNLYANPQATLSVDGRTGTYFAHEVNGEQREVYWQQAVAMYAGYASYKERTGGRQIPIMVLVPEE